MEPRDTSSDREPRRLPFLTRALRPRPPLVVVDPDAAGTFAPDATAASWMRAAFIEQSGPLFNPDHGHLENARVGVLWTNIANRHQERWLVATAEIPLGQGSAWKRGRSAHQLAAWFGWEPDFLITLYAPLLAKITDRDFCAIVEHELYHCAHATTSDGTPRFHRDGSPIFGIRGHDVEEFTGVVRRYGAVGPVRELVDAAARAPIVTADALSLGCGTCAGV